MPPTIMKKLISKILKIEDLAGKLATAKLLPQEIFVLIFEFMNFKALGAASRVCKEWNRLAQQEYLWENLAQKKWGVDYYWINIERMKECGKNFKWLFQCKQVNLDKLSNSFRRRNTMYVGYLLVEGSLFAGDFMRTDKKGDCLSMDGYGFVLHSSGAKYQGIHKNTCREGKGIMMYSEGEVYDGEWRGNLREGLGVYRCGDDVYEGWWQEDTQNGHGSCHYSNGAIYNGTFKNGSRMGYGVCTFPNNTRYEGYWQNDLQHGKGTFFYASGAKFEGEYFQGERCGKGVMTWKSGAVYVGEFADGKENGWGVYTSAQGVYEGYFKDSFYEGKGTFVSKSGNTYDGYFQNGKKHGEALVTWNDGNTYNGLFVDGSIFIRGEWKEIMIWHGGPAPWL